MTHDPKYQKYRAAQIEAGQEYQDFALDVLDRHFGIHLQQYTSRRYQLARGESRNGIEIKHDKQFHRTGRLWIEYAEKAEPRPGPYARSGILRPHWLFVIGDYHAIYGLPTETLRRVYRARCYRKLENHTGTSLAFGLPLADARELAALKLEDLNTERPLINVVPNFDRLAARLYRELLADPRQGTLFPLFEDNDESHG